MTAAWTARTCIFRFLIASAVCAARAVPSIATAQAHGNRVFVGGRLGLARQTRSCPTCFSWRSSSRSGYILEADFGAQVRDDLALGVQYGRWSQVDVVENVDSHSGLLTLFGEVGPHTLPQMRLRVGVGRARHWGDDNALSAHTTIVGAGIGYVFSPRIVSVDTRLDYWSSVKGTRDASPDLGIAEGPFSSRMLELTIGLRVASRTRE